MIDRHHDPGPRERAPSAAMVAHIFYIKEILRSESGRWATSRSAARS